MCMIMYSMPVYVAMQQPEGLLVVYLDLKREHIKKEKTTPFTIHSMTINIYCTTK